MNPIVRGYIVPGRPHPLLCPEQAEHLAEAARCLRPHAREIEQPDADLLILYLQHAVGLERDRPPDPGRPEPRVDPRRPGVARAGLDALRAAHGRRLRRRIRPRRDSAACRRARWPTRASRSTPEPWWPSKLLNPGQPPSGACFSCNMYADRAETIVWGKAVRDALERQNKKAIAVAVTALSNRMFTRPIEASEDRISSVKDDEWNRKILEILGEGGWRTSPSTRANSRREANGDQKLKAIWWLAALMGQAQLLRGQRPRIPADLVGTGRQWSALTPNRCWRRRRSGVRRGRRGGLRRRPQRAQRTPSVTPLPGAGIPPSTPSQSSAPRSARRRQPGPIISTKTGRRLPPRATGRRSALPLRDGSPHAGNDSRCPAVR